MAEVQQAGEKGRHCTEGVGQVGDTTQVLEGLLGEREMPPTLWFAEETKGARVGHQGIRSQAVDASESITLFTSPMKPFPDHWSQKCLLPSPTTAL